MNDLGIVLERPRNALPGHRLPEGARQRLRPRRTLFSDRLNISTSDGLPAHQHSDIIRQPAGPSAAAMRSITGCQAAARAARSSMSPQARGRCHGQAQISGMAAKTNSVAVPALPFLRVHRYGARNATADSARPKATTGSDQRLEMGVVINALAGALGDAGDQRDPRRRLPRTAIRSWPPGLLRHARRRSTIARNPLPAAAAAPDALIDCFTRFEAEDAAMLQHVGEAPHGRAAPRSAPSPRQQPRRTGLRSPTARPHGDRCSPSHTATDIGQRHQAVFYERRQPPSAWPQPRSAWLAARSPGTVPADIPPRPSSTASPHSMTAWASHCGSSTAT